MATKSPDVPPASDIHSAREALRDRKPQALLGLAEGGWLDVKSGIYKLNDPVSADELAKDVAGFANSKTGGLLLVGFSTTKEYDQEILAELRPVPRQLVDLDRHRKLIRDRVIPPPRNVIVEWVDCGEDKGVLVIDVYPQPVACLPYVVPGSARNGRVSDLSVAIPVREGDGTAWLPQAEIHRLLAAGWKETGGPSEEFLGSLIERTVAATRRDSQRPAAPAFQIGEGEPSWAPRFQEVATAASERTALGTPSGPVYYEGCGYVQRFDGGGGDHPWVLSALHPYKPVMVAESVWEALRDAGSGALSGDPLEAVGFPVLGKNVPAADRIVPSDATNVDLNGGSWGPGQLVRDDRRQDWRWEPSWSLSLNSTNAGRAWTGGMKPPELRIRAAASIPWAASGLAITPQSLRKLADDLRNSELAGATTILSKHRDADIPAARWQAGQTGRSVDRGSLACTIASPDGTAALTTEVMLSLTNPVCPEALLIAELRVENLGAWRAVIQAASGFSPEMVQMRLSLDEALFFLSAAWSTVTQVLPAAIVDDPVSVPPAGPPVVELRMSAELQHDLVVSGRDLTDLIDFSPFGGSDRSQIREMSVAITGPLQLSHDERLMRTRQALAYMGQAFGFTNSSEDW